jgi:septal ring factor EnvC (AmiA/AmiB activator)
VFEPAVRRSGSGDPGLRRPPIGNGLGTVLSVAERRLLGDIAGLDLRWKSQLEKNNGTPERSRIAPLAAGLVQVQAAQADLARQGLQQQEMLRHAAATNESQIRDVSNRSALLEEKVGAANTEISLLSAKLTEGSAIVEKLTTRLDETIAELSRIKADATKRSWKALVFGTVERLRSAKSYLAIRDFIKSKQSLGA